MKPPPLGLIYPKPRSYKLSRSVTIPQQTQHGSFDHPIREVLTRVSACTHPQRHRSI
ncbi:hypothetical protein G7068_13640 [Leucobacter viscericola]|uniref:Uncharacterized protein n=1 Tax=Leucobacter viscericola TaxID=2714935 RepID=A0A6G7XIC3_9MICO|nr:hypothetical protein [Leucobacter viscericola]QIK64121.1 hypothetical protein G7068_13640 [Leucobacter viscericola]